MPTSKVISMKSHKQHHDVNNLLILLPDVQLCQFEGAYQLDHSSITSHLNYPLFQLIKFM